MLGDICGYFVGIKALPVIDRIINRSSNGATVGFNIDAIAVGFLILVLGVLGGAIIGLFIALWLV